MTEGATARASGDLAQADLLFAVLGRPVEVVPHDAGLTLIGIGAEDRARLIFLTEVLGGASGAGEVFSIPDQLHPALTPFLIGEVMARYGEHPAAEVARWRGRLMDRAWSRYLASATAPARDLRQGQGSVAVEAESRPHDGFFSLVAHELRPTRFDGERSDVLHRETFHGTDAAIVLPYDPATDRVVLVEQFRMGPFLRGDPIPWTLEPVAGLVDVGETPQEAARREVLEETGISLTGLEPVQSYYASPGGASDYFHSFVGLCDLSAFEGGIGGKADEHEDILSHLLDFDAAMGLTETGEADVGPLILLLYWLALNRSRLRTGRT